MRITTVAPPSNALLQKQCSLPFALLATPFANPENGESDLPLVDMTDLVGVGFDDPVPQQQTSGVSPRTPAVLPGRTVQTPPRCSRCGGYVNPDVNFVEQGNKWICNLCGMSNAVPQW